MLQVISKIKMEELQKTARVILYGAGNYGNEVYDFLYKMGVSVFAYADSDSRKWGQKGGLNVLSPKQLEDGNEYVIIVTVFSERARGEIADSLLRYNINGKIFGGDIYHNIDIPMYFDNKSGRMVLVNRYSFYMSIPWYFHMAYDRYPDKEYVKNLFCGYRQIYTNKGYYLGLDYTSRYVNIKNGMRVTTDIPKDAVKKIVFLGDSRINGYGVEDAQTIPSCVQRMLNNSFPGIYQCQNFSFGAYNFTTFLNRIKDIDLCVGDILLCQLTSIRGYEMEMTVPTGMLQWYITELVKYCSDRGVMPVFLYLGQHQPIATVSNKSDGEKFIYELFRNSTASRRFTDNQCRRFEDIEYWGEFFSNKGLHFINCAKAWECLPEHSNISYFLDEVHLGTYGTRLVAEEIFASLCEQALVGNTENLESVHELLARNDMLYIYPFCKDKAFKEYMEYLEEFKDEKAKVCGAIVVNANPFTKGHKYLVETAAKQVDKLFLFVVEENKSYFEFEDRFEMVKRGVEEYDNVTVIKSGSFIISAKTFPEYFLKEDKEPDCSKDIGIFGCIIAPILNITKRFVGTEPYSVVTNYYNNQMKEILPIYGIDLFEISRIEIEGEIISATKVRNALKNRDMLFIQKVLPESSIAYLKERKLF